MSQSLVKPALKALAAITLLWGAAAWTQDDAQNDGQAAGQETTAAGDGAGETAVEAPADETGAAESEAEGDGGGPAVGLDEIPELDEQTYEEDDDDFIPSEEIPVDQSIPFPTDI